MCRSPVPGRGLALNQARDTGVARAAHPSAPNLEEEAHGLENACDRRNRARRRNQLLRLRRT
jgi:hypothetical protein